MTQSILRVIKNATTRDSTPNPPPPRPPGAPQGGRVGLLLTYRRYFSARLLRGGGAFLL